MQPQRDSCTISGTLGSNRTFAAGSSRPGSRDFADARQSHGYDRSQPTADPSIAARRRRLLMQVGQRAAVCRKQEPV